MKKFYVSLLLFLLGTSSLFAVEYQTIDGIDYMLDASANSAVVTGTPSGAVTIPSNVKYNNRTYNVTGITKVSQNITSLVLPEGITTIVANLCYEKTALISVTLPSTIQRIEKQAFALCYSLISINLPEGLTYIGDGAFSNCSILPTITIPSTLTSMGIRVFENSTNLTKIVWNAKHCVDFTEQAAAPFTIKNVNTGDRYNDYTTSITFGEEVEYIPAYLCSAFLSLSTVTIPNSVKEIGPSAFDGYYRHTIGVDGVIKDSQLKSVKLGTGLEKIGELAFRCRTGLTSISIPDNCTEIGGAAFTGCNNLQIVTIGKNISIIGNNAFWGDTKLNTINIYTVTPPILQYNVFMGHSDLKAITLNVRSKAYDAFNAAEVWKDMYIQVMENDIRTFTLSVSSADASKGITTMGGEYDEETEVLVYAAAKDGYQFSKWSDGNTDNPRTVKMVGNITLTAQFEAVTPVVKYTLTVTANPMEGVAVGGGAFESGAQVTLAAVANTGYHFTQWADGNTSNPRQVTVTADGVYAAQFEKDAVIQRYTLTTSSTNAAQGTAYGQGTYEAGTQIAVFAVANDGYHFTQWHDGNTDNPRTVTVAADAIYFANFAQDPVAPTLYELNVSSESPAKGWTTEGCTYELGAQVMIYAHPAAGFEFSQWSDGNKDNPRFLTMTAEVNLIAQFAVKTTTDVSSANVSAAPAHKILRNGQVYIERNGKIYTVTGAEVK